MEAISLSNAGYEVTVICPRTRKYPKFIEKIDSINILRFPSLLDGRGSAGTLIEYLNAFFWITIYSTVLLNILKFRLVQLCNPPDFLIHALFLTRKKYGLIYDQHDLSPEIWQAKGGKSSGIVVAVLNSLEKFTYKKSDVVISTNSSFRGIARKRGEKDEADIFIVRSAPPVTFMAHSEPINSIASPNQINQSLRIGYLGVMGEQDGVATLIKAFSLLVNEYGKRNLILELIGAGPEFSNLKSFAQSLEVENQINFYGFCETSQVRDILIGCSLAVNPDLPTEMNHLCSANKIVEYMALGIPIVQFAFREGSLTAGEASVYFEEYSPEQMAHSINELLEDETQRTRMSQVGQDRFRELFSWESQVPSLLDAYRRAITVSAKRRK